MPPVRLDARRPVAATGTLAGPAQGPPAELTDYIRHLEQACIDNPESADLRTCLESAYAISYDVCKSMSARRSGEDGRSRSSGISSKRLSGNELEVFHWRADPHRRISSSSARSWPLLPVSRWPPQFKWKGWH